MARSTSSTVRAFSELSLLGRLTWADAGSRPVVVSRLSSQSALVHLIGASSMPPTDDVEFVVYRTNVRSKVTALSRRSGHSPQEWEIHFHKIPPVALLPRNNAHEFSSLQPAA